MIEKDNALITGILEDAEKRADDIIQKAKLDAEDILRQGQEDVVRALEEERRTSSCPCLRISSASRCAFWMISSALFSASSRMPLMRALSFSIIWILLWLH